MHADIPPVQTNTTPELTNTTIQNTATKSGTTNNAMAHQPFKF